MHVNFSLSLCVCVETLENVFEIHTDAAAVVVYMAHRITATAAQAAAAHSPFMPFYTVLLSAHRQPTGATTTTPPTTQFICCYYTNMSTAAHTQTHTIINYLSVQYTHPRPMRGQRAHHHFIIFRLSPAPNILGIAELFSLQSPYSHRLPVLCRHLLPPSNFACQLLSMCVLLACSSGRSPSSATDPKFKHNNNTHNTQQTD